MHFFFYRRRKQKRKGLPEDKAESKELADWSKRSAAAEAKKLLLVGVVFIFLYFFWGITFLGWGLDFLGWKSSSGKVQVGLLMVCVYQRTILVLCTGSSGCLHCWVERGGEREPFLRLESI